MKQRIKELMIQSGAYDHYEVNEGVNGDELPMIKFAELIVAECAYLARQCYTVSAAQADTVAQHIEEAFGR